MASWQIALVITGIVVCLMGIQVGRLKCFGGSVEVAARGPAVSDDCSKATVSGTATASLGSTRSSPQASTELGCVDVASSGLRDDRSLET